MDLGILLHVKVHCPVPCVVKVVLVGMGEGEEWDGIGKTSHVVEVDDVRRLKMSLRKRRDGGVIMHITDNTKSNTLQNIGQSGYCTGQKHTVTVQPNIREEKVVL